MDGDSSGVDIGILDTDAIVGQATIEENEEEEG